MPTKLQEPVVKSLADADVQSGCTVFMDWNGACSNRSAFCELLSDAIVARSLETSLCDGKLDGRP